MSKRLLLFLGVLALAAIGVALAGFSQNRPATKAPVRPKLILLITIDQFRNDHLDRFKPYFVAGGFNRLMGGARFTNCRYDYAVTLTGPGNATLATGAYPNTHGIIANNWYDRALKRQVNCVEDLNTRIVDSAQGSSEQRGASPRRLLGSTLSDELRMASGFESKVISIALKDRSAILAGGHTANAAYWYKAKTGSFVSSTYYMTELPAWVAEFNGGIPAKDYCGRAWKALAETPGANGRVFDEFKPEAGESCPSPRFLAWMAGHAIPVRNRTPIRARGHAAGKARPRAGYRYSGDRTLRQRRRRTSIRPVQPASRRYDSEDRPGVGRLLRGR